MDHHGGVLARLHDLVQVGDAAGLDGGGERPVLPDRLVAAQGVLAHQVRGGQVLVAGHGHEHALEPPAHVLHEARLAAAGRALEHHRQAGVIGGLEELHLVVQRQVVGLLRDAKVLDALRLHRHSAL